MEFDPPASAAPVAGSRTNTHDSGSGLSSGSVSAAMTHHDKPQEKEGPPVSGPSTTGFLDTSGFPDPTGFPDQTGLLATARAAGSIQNS